MLRIVVTRRVGDHETERIPEPEYGTDPPIEERQSEVRQVRRLYHQRSPRPEHTTDLAKDFDLLVFGHMLEEVAGDGRVEVAIGEGK